MSLLLYSIRQSFSRIINIASDNKNARSIMQKQLTRETSLKLAQILQFVTNVTHMERSVRDVEAYIRKVSFFLQFSKPFALSNIR